MYLFMFMSGASELTKLVTFARVVRFLRIIKFGRRMRKWIALDSRRYKKDGFDLDLT